MVFNLLDYTLSLISHKSFCFLISSEATLGLLIETDGDMVIYIEREKGEERKLNLFFAISYNVGLSLTQSSFISG